MKPKSRSASSLIDHVPEESWKAELANASSRYHTIGPWIAIFFNPLFAITDYLNIPEHWQCLLAIRLSISVITLVLVFFKKRLHLFSHTIVALVFTMISLQNAYTYFLIKNDDLLAHNLNYMALIIGAALFLLWEWKYSVIVSLLSILTTSFFVYHNQHIDYPHFFTQGGLLLIASGLFMMVMINNRYQLTVNEIKAKLALQQSMEEIKAQAEEIQGMNENLEVLVKVRTQELEKKNQALEEYAFINAHKLRAPVASILGLVHILNLDKLSQAEAEIVVSHLKNSTLKLDEVVKSITDAIERAD